MWLFFGLQTIQSLSQARCAYPHNLLWRMWGAIRDGGLSHIILHVSICKISQDLSMISVYISLNTAALSIISYTLKCITKKQKPKKTSTFVAYIVHVMWALKKTLCHVSWKIYMQDAKKSASVSIITIFTYTYSFNTFSIELYLPSFTT